jgi:hypothetical protein
MNFLSLDPLITQYETIKHTVDNSSMPSGIESPVNYIDEILEAYSLIMPQMCIYNMQVETCVNDYIRELKELKKRLNDHKSRLAVWIIQNNHRLKEYEQNLSDTINRNLVSDYMKTNGFGIIDLVVGFDRGLKTPYKNFQSALRVQIHDVTTTSPDCKFLLDIILLGNMFKNIKYDHLDIDVKNKMIKIANLLITQFKKSIFLYNVLYDFFNTFINNNSNEQNDPERVFIGIANKFIQNNIKERLAEMSPEPRPAAYAEAEAEEEGGLEEGGLEGGGQYGGALPPPKLIRGTSHKKLPRQGVLEDQDIDKVINHQMSFDDLLDFFIKNMEYYELLMKYPLEEQNRKDGLHDTKTRDYIDHQFKHWCTSENIVYLNYLADSIQKHIDTITYNTASFKEEKEEFLKINSRSFERIDDNLSKLSEIIKQLSANSNTTTSSNIFKSTSLSQENKKTLVKHITDFISLFKDKFQKFPFQLDNSTIKGMSNSPEINVELQNLIDNLKSDDLNDTRKLLEFISQINGIEDKSFGTDILDERRVCGEVEGEQIEGSQCIDIITKCLSGDTDKCLTEFNKLDFDKDINLKTMEYSVALNIAKTLGFEKDTVTNALKKIKETNTKLEISPKLIIIFNAIKAKINYVDLVTFTPNTESIVKKRAIPLRDIGGQTGEQTGGGNTNNYNNFIINLDALKKNLTMKGGSNNYIIVKKNLYYLKELLKADNKQIAEGDLERINRYIDKLQIGEHVISKIDKVITGLTRAIHEKKVDLTDGTLPNKPIAYQMLKELYDKSKEKQDKNLQKVSTLVSLFHGLVPALGYGIA